MAIKFERVKAGMELYDRRKQRMGNTTIRSLSEWPVKILEVDETTRTALVSWNGNSPEKWGERAVRSLWTWSMRDEGVEVTRGIFGSVISARRVKKSKEVKP